MITGYHYCAVILLRFFISIFVATTTSRRLTDRRPSPSSPARASAEVHNVYRLVGRRARVPVIQSFARVIIALHYTVFARVTQ